MDGQHSILGWSRNFFLFASATGSDAHPDLCPMVTGGSSTVVKRPGCEADNSSSSSVDVKNSWMYTSTPPYVFMLRGTFSALSKFPEELSGIALGYGLNDRGFESRQGLGIFSSPPRPDRTTQPSIQWVQGVLFLWVKQPGREADHSPPTSAEVKTA
jgi:hypothetical protein